MLFFQGLEVEEELVLGVGDGGRVSLGFQSKNLDGDVVFVFLNWFLQMGWEVIKENSWFSLGVISGFEIFMFLIFVKGLCMSGIGWGFGYVLVGWSFLGDFGGISYCGFFVLSIGFIVQLIFWKFEWIMNVQMNKYGF